MKNGKMPMAGGNKMKKMKTGKKILCIAAAVVFILAAVVAGALINLHIKTAGIYDDHYPVFDNAKYKKRLPTEDWFAGKKKYMHKLELKKDVKIASSREAAKTYLSLHPEAKHYEYKNFISYDLKNGSDPGVKSFVSELNKKGYSGMIDENDVSWTKSPIIIFNPGQNVKTKNVRKLHYVERVVSTYFV